MTTPKQPSKKGLLHLISYTETGKTALILGTLCGIASALLQVVSYLVIYKVLVQMLNSISAGTGSIADPSLMIPQAFLALGVILASLLFAYLSSSLCHSFAYRFICDLRIKLVEHLKSLPMGRFTTTASGKTMQVLQTEVDQLEGFLAHHLPDLISTISLLVCLFVAMFSLDIRLALVVFLVAVLGFVCQFIPMIKLMKSGAMKENFDALERINAASTEYIHGMPSIKMFGQTPRSFAGFQSHIEAYRDFTVGLSKKLITGVSLFRTIIVSIATFLAPACVALWLWDSPSLSLASTLLFFLVFAPAAATPTLKLRSFSEGMTMMSESVNRIEEILNEEPLIKPRNPHTPRNNSIEFNKVSFSYDAAKEPVLHDVSLSLSEGSFVALVGSSGAGKSTIARLLCRFWDVTQGSVRIGGVDIRDMTEEELTRRVSFVFQENHLFRTSIADNVRMAKPAATDSEIATALDKARCSAFVDALPEGINTIVGNGKAQISGGEAQRIAIARAFLKDSPIVVLDEPTSSLDADTEYEIQQAINVLVKEKTVVMIAHRLSTITNADHIVVMKSGRIAEQGTHQQLLKEKGTYHNLWEISRDTAEWEIASKEEVTHV